MVSLCGEGVPMNPFEAPVEASASNADEPTLRSPLRQTLFLIAAITAACLPIAYIVAIAEGLFFPGMVPGVVRWFVWPGAAYAAAIQIPVYVVWLALSIELTVKQRLGWVGFLLLLNMLAVPVVLLAKYRRTTVSWLQSGNSMK